MDFQKITETIQHPITAIKTYAPAIRDQSIKAVRSQTAKNFLVYSLGGLVLRGANFILLPFITHYLMPAQFGLLSMSRSFVTITTLTLGLGLRQVFGINYFKKTEIERKELLYDLIGIYLIVSLPILLLMYSAKATINRYLFFNNADSSVLFLVFAICSIYFFSELFYQILRYERRAVTLATTQISAAVIRIGLILGLLTYMSAGIVGILFAQLMGLGTVISIGYMTYKNQFPLIHWNLRRLLYNIGPYIMQGIAFIPNIIFIWLLGLIDRWFLGNYISMEQVGLFSMADTFGQLLYVAGIGPLKAAYFPYIYERFSKNSFAKTDAWNKRFIVAIMSAAFILVWSVFTLGQPILYKMLSKNYHQAFGYIMPIMANYILLLGTTLATAPINYCKKTWVLGITLIGLIGFKVVLNSILIPHTQIYGCLHATALTYLIYFIIILWYSRRLVAANAQTDQHAFPLKR